MTRQCGDCQLCCRLLAVRTLDKKAGERCKHQKFKKGCSIYRSPAMPPECAIWNCRWLVNDDTADQSRPDHSHIVIDIMPDFITKIDNETGEETKLQVVQLWVDPKYPDAHRDPAIRAFIARRSREGIATLVRYNASDAFTIFYSDDEWHEIGGASSGRSHSAADIIDFLSEG